MAKKKSIVLGVLTILFGILVIIKPSLLSYVVGAYLIIVGIGKLL